MKIRGEDMAERWRGEPLVVGGGLEHGAVPEAKPVALLKKPRRKTPTPA